MGLNQPPLHRQRHRLRAVLGAELVKDRGNVKLHRPLGDAEGRGDLYRGEGLVTRAQTCYEDALKIAGDNEQAKKRLAALKKR